MVLATHSDSLLHNEPKGKTREGDHVFLEEDEPIPIWNGTILTIYQVIKFVMSSAAEAELGAIFITEKELVPMRQTLIDIGWPHTPTTTQIENSTAEGVANKTIIARKTKSMDLIFHWLIFREAQQQFRFYWATGSKNWADYSTKYHPPI